MSEATRRPGVCGGMCGIWAHAEPLGSDCREVEEKNFLRVCVCSCSAPSRVSCLSLFLMLRGYSRGLRHYGEREQAPVVYSYGVLVHEEERGWKTGAIIMRHKARRETVELMHKSLGDVTTLPFYHAGILIKPPCYATRHIIVSNAPWH